MYRSLIRRLPSHDLKKNSVNQQFQLSELLYKSVSICLFASLKVQSEELITQYIHFDKQKVPETTGTNFFQLQLTEKIRP